MTLDAKFRALATRLIDKFASVPFTLTRITAQVQVETGEQFETDEQYIVNASPPILFRDIERLRNPAIEAEFYVLIAAEALEEVGLTGAPNPATDFIERDGVTYRVVQVEEYYGGDLPAAYKVSLKR